MKRFCVITCEHGGNRIPTFLLARFKPHFKLVHSHEGWDPGALKLARAMAAEVERHAPLGGEHHYSVVSRLVVDLNRSVGHREHHSPMTAQMTREQREEIDRTYYHPYRDAVRASVAAALARGEAVLHLSCHSFNEEMEGERRDFHAGLLFDPIRSTESKLCMRWRDLLGQQAQALDVRFNQPYLGMDDGLVTTLRGVFPDPLYAGVELEVRRDKVLQPAVREALVQTLLALLIEAP